MTCYHPNIIQVQKIDPKIEGVKPYNKTSRIIFANSKEFKGYEYYLNKNDEIKKEWESKGWENPPKYKMIPCGKCVGCRKQERLEWSMRLQNECSKHKNNYFLTLTYNDENIKKKPEFENGYLDKEDARIFIKSLRKWFEREFNWTGFKFYLCGEYGENGTLRPHFHCILINTPSLNMYMEPLNLMNKKTKERYWTSWRIEHIWGKGHIVIGKVNWNSISYTVGYTMKKLFGDVKEEYYERMGQTPIFANMSRRPGIGNEYIKEHWIDIYRTDQVFNDKGDTLKPPKYYDKILANDQEEIYELIKSIREENGETKLKNKLKKINKTLKEQYEIEERTAKDVQKRYSRARIYEG